MPVLSTITVTLKDTAAEASFVDAFVKALAASEGFPGLEKLLASKVIGVDHTYHLHTEWSSVDAMNDWQGHPSYRAVRDTFDVDLVAGLEIARWESFS